jgi:hypothetical protein
LIAGSAVPEGMGQLITVSTNLNVGTWDIRIARITQELVPKQRLTRLAAREDLKKRLLDG